MCIGLFTQPLQIFFHYFCEVYGINRGVIRPQGIVLFIASPGREREWERGSERAAGKKEIVRGEAG